MTAGVRIFAKLRGELGAQNLDKNFFNCLLTTEKDNPKDFDHIIQIPTHDGLEDMSYGLQSYVLSQLVDFWHLFKPHSKISVQQQLVFIGLSTGGPIALEKVLPDIQLSAQTIYVIAQHMPAGQTKGLVDHLQRRGVKIREAVHLEPLKPGVWYVLPSGFQSFLCFDQHQRPLFYQTTTPEALHKPLIDYALYSLAAAYSSRLLAGILTGMGTDGALALRASQQFGSSTFAESRDSALVFGMPKAAIEFGGTKNEIILDEIPDFINSWIRSTKGRSDVA